MTLQVPNTMITKKVEFRPIWNLLNKELLLLILDESFTGFYAQESKCFQNPSNFVKKTAFLSYQ